VKSGDWKTRQDWEPIISGFGVSRILKTRHPEHLKSQNREIARSGEDRPFLGTRGRDRGSRESSGRRVIHREIGVRGIANPEDICVSALESLKPR
jgi:hypothetical protein